ncbi:hypothetical protein PVAG01_10367 [Phlyctema vagabunda]|uniref:DUF7702 domain-containing protein n=1 Tax=Phlyctema vagabunda TaxID=108571 RepID=A0ABR4P5Q4_9HELO
MATLSSRQSLSIVVIVYFTPILIAALWICVSRGLGQQFGWLYLSILALARIVGSSLQLAARQDGSDGLSTTARAISSSGLAALILVMLELILKIGNDYYEREWTPRITWRLLHLSQWAAFILSVVGIASGNERLSKAALIIMATIFAVLSFISVATFILAIPAYILIWSCDQTFGDDEDTSDLLGERERVFTILVCTVPFLTVRVTYGLLDMFVTRGSTFGGSQPNVVALGLMQYMMECIVATLYITAGFLVASWRKKVLDEENQTQMTMSKDNNYQADISSLQPSGVQ